MPTKYPNIENAIGGPQIVAALDAGGTRDFDAALARFVAAAQAMINATQEREFPGSKLHQRDLSVMPGKRYVRVVIADRQGPSRSVYCFVDTTNGNILKSASWKTPAKGVRGNIYAENPLSAVTQYGARYNR